MNSSPSLISMDERQKPSGSSNPVAADGFDYITLISELHNTYIKETVATLQETSPSLSRRIRIYAGSAAALAFARATSCSKSVSSMTACASATARTGPATLDQGVVLRATVPCFTSEINGKATDDAQMCELPRQTSDFITISPMSETIDCLVIA